MPVAAYVIGGAGLEDRDGLFQKRYGVDEDGAVLVRPDGVVAWRSSGGDDAPTEQLEDALRAVLGQPDDRPAAAPLGVA